MNTNTNTARALVADLRPGSTIIRPGSLSEIVSVIATDSSVWSVTTLFFSDGTDMLMKNYSEVTRITAVVGEGEADFCNCTNPYCQV